MRIPMICSVRPILPTQHSIYDFLLQHVERDDRAVLLAWLLAEYLVCQPAGAPLPKEIDIMELTECFTHLVEQPWSGIEKKSEWLASMLEMAMFRLTKIQPEPSVLRVTADCDQRPPEPPQILLVAVPPGILFTST